MSQPTPAWSTCTEPVDHGPHPWHDPWPLPHGQEAHCPGRPTPEPRKEQPTTAEDRLTVDTITSDQLDALQLKAARMEAAVAEYAKLRVKLEDTEARTEADGPAVRPAA